MSKTLTRKQKIRRIIVSLLLFFAFVTIIGSIFGIVFGLDYLANTMGMSLGDLVMQILGFIIIIAAVVALPLSVGLMCYAIAEEICDRYEAKKQENTAS
jgi:uncharacterized membrane protein